MDEGIRKPAAAHDLERVSLGELIHEHVRVAIETAVHEELLATLGVQPYERHEARRGYCNGTKTRMLTGPSGPLALTVPRATLFDGREWASALRPRYQPRYATSANAARIAYATFERTWARSQVKTRPDQIAQDRRLAEDRRGAETVRGGGGMMIVRAVLVVVLGLGVTAVSVDGAQQAGRLYRLGTFDIAQPSSGNEVKGPSYLEPNAPFFRALRELGWIEGRNLSVERRYASSPEQLPNIAAELVRLNVDVIAVLSAGLAEVAHQATKSIPIVTISAGDLEGTGLIKSLARPGGNVTGMQVHNPELMGKRIQLLKELMPSLSRLAVLEPITPAGAITANYFQSINDAAARIGAKVQRFPVHSVGEIAPTFSAMARDRVHGVLVIANPLSVAGRAEIATSAERHRLPVMYEAPAVFAAQGLISFGAVASDVQSRAATFVDRLFKGARAADLPVEQPTKFQLVVNLKAAKAIGLTIPVSLLSRADQIIE